MIPNNETDSANTIANFHKKLLLEIGSQLNLNILLIRSDGIAAEFQAQSIIINTQTIEEKESKMIH